MTGPAEVDCRASMRDGIKVAILAALGFAAAVAIRFAHHDTTAALIAVATVAGVLTEGRPKAARARRRYPR